MFSLKCKADSCNAFGVSLSSKRNERLIQAHFSCFSRCDETPTCATLLKVEHANTSESSRANALLKIKIWRIYF